MRQSERNIDVERESHRLREKGCRPLKKMKEEEEEEEEEEEKQRKGFRPWVEVR
jgi:hypothetical protein